MLRSKLLAELQNVAPALSINPLIPLLTHFWFTGSKLMAFNDQIALAVEHPTSFKGAVPGTLLELLKVGQDGADGELALSADAQALVVKAPRGATLIKLAMLAPEFVFTMPQPADADAGPIAKLIRGFEHCLLSVGTDTSHAEYLGITLEPDERGGTALYSIDGGSLSRFWLKQQWLQNGGRASRAIVPGAFCAQAVRLYRAASEKERGQASFELGERLVGTLKERYSLLRVGRTLLYGRQLETTTPMPFQQLLKEHLPTNYHDQLILIPEEFPDALERAYIVCEQQRRRMKIVIDGQQMRLAAQSDLEDVQDTIRLKKRHANIEVSVEPRLLRRGLAFAEEMVVSKDSVALVRSGRLYVVACS